jgi:hypothetical protein
LARDAPIGTRFDGGFDAVFAPIGNPGDLLDRLLCFLAEGVAFAFVIDADEPLIHRAENDRCLAAPAMRVAVMIIFLVQERVADAEFVDDGDVGVALAMFFENRFADHFLGHLIFARQVVRVGEFAIVIDGRIDRQADGTPEQIVLHAVAGCDVDETGAGGVIDEMIAGVKFADAFAEGMRVFELRNLVAGECAHDLVTFPTGFLHDRRKKHVREQEHFFADADERVVEGGVVSDREIGGQSPRRRGPDQDVSVWVAEDWELHVDALRNVVFIFDFGFGEGGAARDAPIDRLLSAIDETLIHDVREHAEFLGFVFLCSERQIRIFPIAEHAEAAKLRALEVDVFVRVFLASAADGRGVAGGVAGFAHFLGHFEFDRQAVAIPAGHVRRVSARERVEADDDVFENFVEGVADVHVAVRERRPIVQNEFGRAGAALLDALIELARFPLRQPLRFPCHQIGFHRKVRLGQI